MHQAAISIYFVFERVLRSSGFASDFKHTSTVVSTICCTNILVVGKRGCPSAAFMSEARIRTLSCLSQDVGYPVWQQQRGAPGFKGRRKWPVDGE